MFSSEPQPLHILPCTDEIIVGMFGDFDGNGVVDVICGPLSSKN